MPLDISFAQFDAISSGKYNAGQIDYKGEGEGASLKKVNAHVQIVERIEKEIRDNPAKYPLLTKYYLNAE